MQGSSNQGNTKLPKLVKSQLSTDDVRSFLQRKNCQKFAEKIQRDEQAGGEIVEANIDDEEDEENEEEEIMEEDAQEGEDEHSNGSVSDGDENDGDDESSPPHRPRVAVNNGQ